MKYYLLSCCVAALLTSCSGNDQKSAANAADPANANATTAGGASASASVTDLDQQFVSAWNNKDASKITAMLADDVQFLQGETRFSGKDEVTNKWITPTINTIANLKTNGVSTGSNADMAYEAGTFSVDVLPTATEKATGLGTGNYVFIWKKASDGSWKISLAHLEDLPVQEKK
ncbi:DUF4440 domain-containing protein [Hymenobacter sp. H14-R3]|uniref:YybH family protein n=1 Tax=Hymenobacter sp. H14-R3 TaxID=3046308 RepID=UPI0024B8AB78|nr:DUF4440 domain-containing protein [Hymenobacter sp. H14-R3]MDJ0366857.1 DUF4440 domain-containing protein [Hymenobacter sp. H14-R3]